MKFVNAAFFKEGVNGSYSKDRDVSSAAAHGKLMAFISGLPAMQQTLIATTPIPGASSNLTLGDRINPSNKDQVSCITRVCVDVAKVLWAKCPDIQLSDFKSELRGYLEDTIALHYVVRDTQEAAAGVKCPANQAPLFEALNSQITAPKRSFRGIF